MDGTSGGDATRGASGGTGRRRVRRALNGLLVLTALVGTVAGAWVIVTTLQARDAINEACDGLVPAGRVLALTQSDGRTAARYDQRLVPDGDACDLCSTDTGQGEGRRWFFTASAGTLATRAQTPDTGSFDFGTEEAPTVAQPLGSLIDGNVTDAAVTVQLSCRVGKLNGKPVKSLWARAALVQPKDGRANAHDRHVLAEIAVGTVNNLSRRAGCERQWAPPGDGAPAAAPGPQSAADATGTCAFARDLARDGAFPDRASTAPSDGATSKETCGLYLSRSRAVRLWDGAGEGATAWDRPTRAHEYWAVLHTYYGDLAGRVSLAGPHGVGHEVPAAFGKAGKGPRLDWWASSTCAEGGHAVHTLSLAPAYGELTAARWEKAFRAYVKQVAVRRGCRVEKFPAAADFTAAR